MSSFGRFSTTLRAGPAGLVLSGEPGIGKTILWQAAVEEARGRFAHVLTCQGGPPDPLAIGLAVHDVLRVAAQQGSVLIAVDDVQWLDPASAGALEVAFRRLRTDQIGVLVASRRTAAATIPLGLGRSLPEERLTVLSVGLGTDQDRRADGDFVDIYVT